MKIVEDPTCDSLGFARSLALVVAAAAVMLLAASQPSRLFAELDWEGMTAAAAGTAMAMSATPQGLAASKLAACVWVDLAVRRVESALSSSSQTVPITRIPSLKLQRQQDGVQLAIPFPAFRRASLCSTFGLMPFLAGACEH